MAERRMLSKKIIDSDEFLDLPLNAQCLYFHLSMQADDDGFISSPRKILRSIGAGEGDLELLIKKKFIIAFDSGIVAIRHWKVHNCIRKDRYKSTMFLNEKKQLISDETDTYVVCPQSTPKANLPRNSSDNQLTTNWQPSDNQTTTNWQPTDNQMTSQVRLGKDSIDKDSLGKGRVGKESKEEERIEKFSLGEGSIESIHPHAEENEIDFSSEWAVAPFPTGKCLHNAPHHLPEEQYNYETHRLPEEQHYSPDISIAPDRSNRYLLDGEAEGLPPCAEGKFEEASHTGRGVSFADGEGTLKPVEGPYGRGIVRLTDGQLADLKERLGENQLNRYMDKLASFISSRGARIRSHYDTLLKWYEEDLKHESAAAIPTSNAPSYSGSASLPPQKPRYGSFDPTEAFMAALKRSNREVESDADSNQ